MSASHINQAPAFTVGTNKHSHPTSNYGAAAVNRYVFKEFSSMDLAKILLPLILTTSFFCNAEQTELERTLSQKLTNAVIQINSNVPQVLDEETRLDSAATFRNFIIYNSTMVNYSADQLDVNAFNPIIEEVVIGTLCAKKGLESFIDLGVIMVYRYHGKNGQYISELFKDMATCKKT
jgi:predicted glycosyltransferase